MIVADGNKFKEKCYAASFLKIHTGHPWFLYPPAPISCSFVRGID
jgi:hypothetical protein